MACDRCSATGPGSTVTAAVVAAGAGRGRGRKRAARTRTMPATSNTATSPARRAFFTRPLYPGTRSARGSEQQLRSQLDDAGVSGRGDRAEAARAQHAVGLGQRRRVGQVEGL